MSKFPTTSPLHPLIPYNSPVLLIGARGTFKTAVAYAIARAVSQGLPFGGLPTSKREVVLHTKDNMDDFDNAGFEIEGTTSEISEPFEDFLSVADMNLEDDAADMKMLASMALKQPCGCLMIIDDIASIVGIRSATDKRLTGVVDSIISNTRSTVSTLMTLTATRHDLVSRYPTLARQFKTILEVERWCGENFTLRVLHSKVAPELFSLDGEVHYVQHSLDEEGNALRVPYATPSALAAHNVRF